MPGSWQGHFDPETGISYMPWGRISGRPGLLMHSPWRKPPGRTTVEYQLTLPKVSPASLNFGIAMAPDVATPDKSDGVTFSVLLVINGKEQPLMREHYARAEWRDFQFDLSPYAGQTVGLRLQVEPGPRNSSSFDLAFFGDARITLGEPGAAQNARVEKLLRQPAYLATAKTSGLNAGNRPGKGVLPSNLLEGRNRIETTTNGFRLLYEGKDGRLVYTYQPRTGTMADFQAQFGDTPVVWPAAHSELTVDLAGPTQTQSQPQPVQAGKALSVRQVGQQIKASWQYSVTGKTVTVDWTFGIQGKALTVEAVSSDPAISRFSLGTVSGAALRKTIPIPYLDGTAQYLPVQGVYVCRFLDWTVSHASRCPQGEAAYDRKTDGTRNPLRESGYLAVSPDISEVLPNIPHPPSPYIGLLGPRIMLDIWGHRKGTFASDAETLQQLKDHGVDHVAIIQHDWQRYGYDVKLPDHIPANPRQGGDEAMKVFGRTANQMGYVWSVHENYIDLYPDAPSYDPTARVLTRDGSPSKAWFNEGTQVQSYGLKCNRALEFARSNSPGIHANYQTTASYLDVHTCVPPWHQLDHDATQPQAAMALAKVKHDAALFQYERDTHQGPLFGEGANHFYWAGLCDGVEAQVQGGEDHLPFLDFDLLKIHPQMVNHGMGYYERWFRQGYQSRWGFNVGSMEQIDKYRAMEMAYGHAGFVSSSQAHNIPWIVREHHLMHPVQHLYGNARATEIRYEVNGRWVTASAALPLDATSRQRIRYDSGLTVWVNWQPEPWAVEGRQLPQWGVLALGPGTEVHTALHAGKVVDYSECPDFAFADTRTWFPLPYRHGPRGIEPRLRAFQYLGENRVRVTYEWVVEEALDRDYHCFVHGTAPGLNTADKIAFQQDHGLPKPTSQWRPGDVIVDGPHEFTIPATASEYELVTGLFLDDRLKLKGSRDEANRIRLARLVLERQNGRITGIKSSPPTAATNATAGEIDFSARLNPAGTWVDFGSIATDGAVKVNKSRDRLVVYPYPREKQFNVELDLAKLAPTANRKRLTIQALAIGTGEVLQTLKPVWQGKRLGLTVGTARVGRYLITWD